ncbi:MAG: 23S rRNA (guanosine(2251)-2'-O)-methyltransferase RlmB [Syntrophotaleaceae bacterium]
MAEFIYGINPVREALLGGGRRPLLLILAEGSQSSRHQEILLEAGRANVPVIRKKRQELDRLAGTSHHQGALLEIEPFAYADLEDLLVRRRQSGQKAFFLVLDGITDPHNLGAILRSADAAGCHGVIMARDRSCPVTAVVDKVSAGALEHVPLCRVTNLARTLEKFKSEGMWVYGLAGEGDSVSLYKGTDLTGDVVLVVGSEGSGLRANVRRHCDLLLAIPMAGRVSSLNASVAAALALFEVVRQRQSSEEN